MPLTAGDKILYNVLMLATFKGYSIRIYPISKSVRTSWMVPSINETSTISSDISEAIITE